MMRSAKIADVTQLALEGITARTDRMAYIKSTAKRNHAKMIEEFGDVEPMRTHLIQSSPRAWAAAQTRVNMGTPNQEAATSHGLERGSIPRHRRTPGPLPLCRRPWSDRSALCVCSVLVARRPTRSGSAVGGHYVQPRLISFKLAWFAGLSKVDTTTWRDCRIQQRRKTTGCNRQRC